MRVAIIVKEFPPDSIGGLQTQTKRMATAIGESDSETDVVIFTKRYRNHDDSGLPFEVVRIPHLGISPFISDLTFLAFCFFSLLRYSKKFDCMQCMTVYPIGFLGFIVNYIMGIPYFAWIRGNDFYEMRHVWWKQWMIRQVLSDTRVLVQSTEIEEDVHEFFPELDPDIGVLGNGVSVPNTRSPLKSNAVLFVGRLVQKKGVKYLVEAMDNVSCEAELWIVGDGCKRGTLERLVEDLDTNVDFYGELNPDEVTEFYRQASVLTLPSIEGEGMPNVVLEAMAYGIPVITTDSGGLPTVIEDGQNGYLVPMRDSTALAEKIEQLMTDKNLRERIGKEGRNYVIKNHSWDYLVQKLELEYVRQTTAV